MSIMEDWKCTMVSDRASGSTEYIVKTEDGWITKGVDGHTVRPLWTDPVTQFSVALVRFKKGSGVPGAHKHASNQFMYCIQGRYEYASTGVTLEPGSFYHNPKDSVHGPTIAHEDCLLIEIYDGPAYYERPAYYDAERPVGANE